MGGWKSIVGPSLLLAMGALAAASPLGAADRKTELANRDNLKKLSQGREVKVVLNDAKAYERQLPSVPSIRRLTPSDGQLRAGRVAGTLAIGGIRPDLPRLGGRAHLRARPGTFTFLARR